jgi:hypothetical protein
LKYEPKGLIVPIGQDPTPFIEEEDLDIFLFVDNVQNGKRKDTIYRNYDI